MRPADRPGPVDAARAERRVVRIGTDAEHDLVRGNSDRLGIVDAYAVLEQRPGDRTVPRPGVEVVEAEAFRDAPRRTRLTRSRWSVDRDDQRIRFHRCALQPR